MTKENWTISRLCGCRLFFNGSGGGTLLTRMSSLQVAAKFQDFCAACALKKTLDAKWRNRRAATARRGRSFSLRVECERAGGQLGGCRPAGRERRLVVEVEQRVRDVEAVGVGAFHHDARAIFLLPLERRGGIGGFRSLLFV